MPHAMMLLSNPCDPDPRVENEAKGLVEQGHQVTVVGWDREGTSTLFAKRDGVHFRRIRVRGGFQNGWRQIFGFFRFWLSAFQHAVRLRPDLIHCHDFDTLPAGWLAARWLRVPVIFDAHESYPDMMEGHLPWPLVTIIRWAEKLLVGRVDCMITVGERLRKHYVDLGARNVVVIGNWKYLVSGDPEEAARRRAEWGVEEDGLAVGYVGQFQPDRRLTPLIEAAEKNPRVHLVLAGKGPDLAKITAAAERCPNIHYLGFVPAERISEVFTACDLVYYGLADAAQNPNNYYSAPNSLFNALAAGKPVMTSDTGEIAEVVQTERCGIVLEDLTQESVGAALDAILAGGASLDDMSRNAARAARRKYNWEQGVKVLNQLYRETLTRAGR